MSFLFLGEVHFKNVKISCSGSCRIGEVSTDSLNGYPVPELFNEIIRIDKDEILDTLHLEEMTVTGPVTINGGLNGRPMSDYVTLSGDHHVTGSKTIAGDVYLDGGAIVTDTIDGVQLDSSHVLLSEGDQVIEGKSFKSDWIPSQTISVIF